MKSKLINLLLFCVGLTISQGCGQNNSTAETSTLIYHGITTHRWSSFVTPGTGQADAIEAEGMPMRPL